MILQAALSLVLLVGAGLMAKSLNKLENQDFGVSHRERVVAHFSPENAGYKPEELQALYDKIDQEYASGYPEWRRCPCRCTRRWKETTGAKGCLSREGRSRGPNSNTGASWLRVSPEYFDIVGHRVVRGRGSRFMTRPLRHPVVVVNEAFVKKFFPKGENPIGVHFGVSGVQSSRDWEIVGVVSDIKYNNLRARASDVLPAATAGRAYPA